MSNSSEVYVIGFDITNITCFIIKFISSSLSKQMNFHQNNNVIKWVPKSIKSSPMRVDTQNATALQSPHWRAKAVQYCHAQTVYYGARYWFKALSEIFEGGYCDVYVHVTRSQLELIRARCKISNKGYLSLNIFVILCHNMVIRSWDITTIPKGLSETFFGRF